MNSGVNLAPDNSAQAPYSMPPYDINGGAWRLLNHTGFTLLPTFRRPHLTLLLKTVDQVEALLELLGLHV